MKTGDHLCGQKRDKPGRRAGQRPRRDQTVNGRRHSRQASGFDRRVDTVGGGPTANVRGGERRWQGDSSRHAGDRREGDSGPWQRNDGRGGGGDDRGGSREDGDGWSGRATGRAGGDLRGGERPGLARQRRLADGGRHHYHRRRRRLASGEHGRAGSTSGLPSGGWRSRGGTGRRQTGGAGQEGSELGTDRPVSEQNFVFVSGLTEKNAGELEHEVSVGRRKPGGEKSNKRLPMSHCSVIQRDGHGGRGGRR